MISESSCAPCDTTPTKNQPKCGTPDFQRLVHVPLGELMGGNAYELRHAPDNSYYYLTIPDSVIQRRHVLDAFFKCEDQRLFFVADVHIGTQVVAAGPLELVQLVVVARTIVQNHSAPKQQKRRSK